MRGNGIPAIFMLRGVLRGMSVFLECVNKLLRHLIVSNFGKTYNNPLVFDTPHVVPMSYQKNLKQVN